jgi:hypothetical protein
MAVLAGHVASVPDIDLKSLNLRSPEGITVMFFEGLDEFHVTSRFYPPYYAPVWHGRVMLRRG